jgi:tetratricopeptide (TPR) repeat protein
VQVARVRAALVSGQRTRIGQAAAFVGLGGLGKTQLAVEYGHAHRGAYPGGVYWFHADQDLEAQITRLAIDARWVSPQSEPAETLVIARQQLQLLRDALFIFDNVEDRRRIEALLPTGDRRSHVLLTSRHDQTGFALVELDVLGEADGIALLERVSGRSCGDADARRCAARIVARLDGLPLALEIVGAYLARRRSVTWPEVADRLERRGIDAPGLGDAPGFEQQSLTGHQANLRATLALDAEMLAENLELEKALEVLAWTAPASMGRDLLEALVCPDDLDELRDGLSLACALKIMQIEAVGGGNAPPRYRMHRLVQEVHRGAGEETRLLIPAATVLSRLGDWFEARREGAAGTEVFDGEQDHLEAALVRATDLGLLIETARLTWLKAYVPHYRDDHRTALTGVERALELLDTTPNDSMLLQSRLLVDRSYCVNRLGHYSRARAEASRALTLLRQLAEESPTQKVSEALAEALHALARTSIDANSGELARSCAEENLQLRLRLFGAADWRTGAAHRLLAEALTRFGEGRRALEMASADVEITLSVFGKWHRQTCFAYNMLGICRDSCGDRAGSLDAYLESHAIAERVLGPTHADTATQKFNLGVARCQLGQFDAGMRLVDEGIRLGIEARGVNHPSIFERRVTKLLIIGKHDRSKQAAAYQAIVKIRQDLPGDHPSLPMVRRVMDQIRPDGFRKEASSPSPSRPRPPKKPKRR